MNFHPWLIFCTARGGRGAAQPTVRKQSTKTVTGTRTRTNVMLRYSEASAFLIARQQILRGVPLLMTSFPDDIVRQSNALGEEPAVDNDRLAGGIAGGRADEIDRRPP